MRSRRAGAARRRTRPAKRRAKRLGRNRRAPANPPPTSRSLAPARPSAPARTSTPVGTSSPVQTSTPARTSTPSFRRKPESILPLLPHPPPRGAVKQDQNGFRLPPERR
ncbi:hypothetical protein J5226_16025 [Lysobacter sp. K5869]|nr:hypothetical protein J5226_16025 [Lysobacter sp. K5869]